MKERLFDVSDQYRLHVCEQCGLIAIANYKKGVYECKRCSNFGTEDSKRKPNIYQVRIPYACKLMMQELITMNVCSRLVTEG